MAKCAVLECQNYLAIKQYFNDTHWSQLVELRTHWSAGFRKKWHREYIRQSLKPRYCRTWWWVCMDISQQAIRIPARPHSEWPDSRCALIWCLFVFRGAQVIISGLAGESVCYDLGVPKELCVMVREFVGELPSLSCDDGLKNICMYPGTSRCWVC